MNYFSCVIKLINSSALFLLFFFFSFFCLPKYIYSQSAKYNRLTIGDKVPDVVFSSVRNYSGAAKRLSDFKGKYIILDFWDRTCTSCIEGMPKMESLQEEFKDNLQILLVTKNSETGLSHLFNNSAIVKSVKLPMVLNDSLLTKHLFPYKYLPRHIWIDKEGKVLAITQASEAVPENISKMINGEKLELTNREDIVDENELLELFSETSSLLFSNNSRYLKYLCYFNSGHGQLDNTEPNQPVHDSSYSLLMTRIAGAKEYDVKVLKNERGADAGMRLINTSLKNLYRFAFKYGGDSKYRIPGKLLLEPGVFIPEPDNPSEFNTWMDKISYCYETRFGEFSLYKVPDRLRADLEAYFGVTAIIEDRQLPCYVFYRDSSSGRLSYAKENEPTYFVNGRSGEGILYSNMQYLDIFNQIMYSHSSDRMPPIINETGLTTEKLTMFLHINNFENLELLNSDLKKSGLKLKRETRNIKVLVLRKMGNARHASVP